jgi:hypothetical protein
MIAATMKQLVRLPIVAAVLLSLSGIQWTFAQKPVTGVEARTIAEDAYIYAFAMMESYQTWRTQAVDRSANGYVGGFNVFRHYSEPFTPANKASFTAVVLLLLTLVGIQPAITPRPSVDLSQNPPIFP